jgi:hypothetical protein
MNEQKIMNIEAFNEIIENFEIVGKLTEYGRKNIKYHVKRLQQENQQLKERVDTLKETQIKQLQIIEDKDKKIYKALHRIQLLQMDGEVSTKDLGKIANILIDKEVE